MRNKMLLACGAALAALTLTACNGAPVSTPVNGSTNAPAEKPGGGTFDSLKALSDAVTEKSSSTNSSHVKLSGDVAGEKISGEGDFSLANDSIAMQMAMSTSAGDIEMRFVDNVIYMKMPQPLTPGKPWLKIDLADKNNPMADIMGKSLSSIKSTDPRETIKELAKAGEIKSVKDDEIDGKPVKHYSILVDVAKVSKDNNLGIDATALGGAKEMPVDVWIDGDNLPARVALDIPAKAASGKMQMDYSDWGKTVKVEAPDASEVAEFPGSR